MIFSGPGRSVPPNAPTTARVPTGPGEYHQRMSTPTAAGLSQAVLSPSLTTGSFLGLTPAIRDRTLAFDNQK